MKRIFVYAGYYELYITDKEINSAGKILDTEFDNVPDAEKYVEETEDYLWLDRDLIDESLYCWEGDDYENHTFDFVERFGSHIISA